MHIYKKICINNNYRIILKLFIHTYLDKQKEKKVCVYLIERCNEISFIKFLIAFLFLGSTPRVDAKHKKYQQECNIK